MSYTAGDVNSTLFYGLSAFWSRYFKDSADLEAFYQASETYLGQVYLDLLNSILNIGLIDTPVFSKEYWKLFTVRENELRFREGEAVADDRFLFDPPDATADLDVLQNSILSPTILFERDLNFDVVASDGIIRFLADPFKGYEDSSSNWLPLDGIPWRYQTISVGNKFTDTKRRIAKTPWYSDSEIQSGDTLRLLGYRGVLLASWDDESDNWGTFSFDGTDLFFTTADAVFVDTEVGDMLYVYGSGGPCDGNYLIKTVVSGHKVCLEPTMYAVDETPPISFSWQIYDVRYFETPKDYLVDFLDKTYILGPADNPINTDFQVPLVYSVVRGVADPDVYNFALSTIPDVHSSGAEAGVVHDPVGTADMYIVRVDHPIFSGVLPENLWFYAPATPNNPQLYGRITSLIDAATFRIHLSPLTLVLALDTPTPPPPHAKYVSWTIVQTPTVTDTGYRQLICGTVYIRAKSFLEQTNVLEGRDYTVDYLRGFIVPLRPWSKERSHNTARFRWQRELFFSASGESSVETTHKIKQISLWSPEAKVDRFALYYNYGSLINRFSASSDAYKTFLRGVFHLYTCGPSFSRIESALNVCAGYPIATRDGEVLTAYDNGITATGADGVMTSGINVFSSASRHFVSDDIGGFIVIREAVNDMNKGKFRILEISDTDDTQVLLDADYGVADETGLSWTLTRTDQKIVTTSFKAYKFPFSVPIKPEIEDSKSLNVLTFNAFDSFTTAFTAVDYLSDPNWYYNKTIPQVLWEGSPFYRRIASSGLYENVINPSDGALVGDPGFYIGADTDGNLTADPTTNPSYHRTAAFVLFDKYLKFHMFYVEIAPDLELSQSFLTDLEQLILVAKPAWVYPYVESETDIFSDIAALTEAFRLGKFGLHFGNLEELQLADNRLKIGDVDWYVGDYFYYHVAHGTSPTTSPPPAPWVVGMPIDNRGLKLHLTATIGGKPIREGTSADYTADYDPASLTKWTVTPLTTWDVGPRIPIRGLALVKVNLSVTPIPDTTLGFTPFFVGGLNPGYVKPDITNLDVPTVSQVVDHALSVKVSVDGFPYIYPGTLPPPT